MYRVAAAGAGAQEVVLSAEKTTESHQPGRGQCRGGRIQVVNGSDDHPEQYDDAADGASPAAEIGGEEGAASSPPARAA